MNGLYHHGVKGMKWGVRRYQNKSGGSSASSSKRLAKKEAYRDKLSSKASKKSEKYKNSARKARENVKDLEKNGTKSEAYRKWKETADDSRAWEHNRRSLTPYEHSWNKIFNDIDDHFNSKGRVQELIKENKADAEKYKNRGKRWTKANENLMKMDVTELTSKRDIRRVYRSKQ